MGLTAKEFAKLPEEEKRKRFRELDNREASIYRIYYDVVWGKSVPSGKPPVKHTPEEKEKRDRELFALMKQFHDVPEDMTFEEWLKGVKEVD